MIWIRIFILVFVVLAAIYYGMLMGQIFSDGGFKFTNRRIEFIRCIMPFYYWIAPYNEKPKKVVKRVKPIIDNSWKHQQEEVEKSNPIGCDYEEDYE